MKTERRVLVFANFEELIQEVDRLLQNGYTKLGNWDLGQILFHLKEWTRYPMDGYPRLPLLLKPVFWVVRNFFAKKLAAKLLKGGKMDAGMSTAPQSVDPNGGKDREMADAFKETLARWRSYSGELFPSPLFGKFTRAEADQVQRIHAAHHLSFLIPNH